MKIEKISLDGKKNSIDVKDTIVAAKINKQLVSNLLYKINANYKGRKAKTKQKNEIIGSTAKIYAQKGTGNARHASRKAPIFVGGGVAHGPIGESNYKIRKLNKSEKNYSSTIEVDLPHKPGALGKISSLIGINKGNIINIELIKRKKEHLTFSFDLHIKDLKNFTNLISQIKQSNLNFKIIRHKQKKNAFIRRIFENFKRN